MEVDFVVIEPFEGHQRGDLLVIDTQEEQDRIELHFHSSVVRVAKSAPAA